MKTQENEGTMLPNKNQIVQITVLFHTRLFLIAKIIVKLPKTINENKTSCRIFLLIKKTHSNIILPITSTFPIPIIST